MPVGSRLASRRARLVAALSLSVVGCSSGEDAPASHAPACDVHASSATSFVDRSVAWGLDAAHLAVNGNRFSAVDLDGDAFPDLVVHAISSNARDTLSGGPKLVRVLMNRPAPGGGRTFVDATVESGLFRVRDAEGVLRSAQLATFGDVDGDGDLDAFSGTYVDPGSPSTDPGDRSEILLNDGTGHFGFAPASDPTPSASERWPTTGATFLDYDRDGRLDLFVGFWYARYGRTEYGVQAQLYRGNGDGTFASVTDAAGLATDQDGFEEGTNTRPAYGVSACDLDDDGAPELLVSAYGRQWSQLYRNERDGTFKELGRESGFAGDLDLDYHDNQFFACFCTSHADAADCAGVGAPLVQCPDPADSAWRPGVDDQPWRLNGNNFTTYCGDFDGDGDLDLYSAQIRHWHVGQSSDASELLVNERGAGGLAFRRPGNATTGMVWPHPTQDWNEGGLMAAGADVDNDARLDLVVAASDYPGNWSLLFHQRADRSFEDVDGPWGLHHACASGLAIADFDRDGDLDVVVGSGTARDCSKIWATNEVHLYESDASRHAGYVAIRLVGDGTTASTSAFGARVRVTAGGVTQTAEASSSYGHMAIGNDRVLFFGLGACDRVDSVEVRWPDRANTVEVHGPFAAGRLVELRQGDAQVHEVALAR